MTGWRISELLALRREDVDVDARTALTRHKDNKGGRDEVVPLHPRVIEHLPRTEEPTVFPWPHDRRTLDTEFHHVQSLAGIHLPCLEDHEHTPACHLYGFHDLRRAFATYNSGVEPAKMQRLMRHQDFSTTLRYVNPSRQLDETVRNLHVPALPHRVLLADGVSLECRQTASDVSQ